jgi:hypothetical protein
MSLRITSTTFSLNAVILALYTCKGKASATARLEPCAAMDSEP